jgi:hypothetical protein
VPKSNPPPLALPPLPPIRVIDPYAVFRLDELRVVLGLPRTTLRREVRQGRLRVVKRAGCYWCLGRWLIQYFEDGPAPKSRAGQVRPDCNGVT